MCTCSSLQLSANATTPSSVILVHWSALKVSSCGLAAARPLKPSSPMAVHLATLMWRNGKPRPISASRLLLTSGMPVSMTHSRAGEAPVRMACSALPLTPLHSLKSSSLRGRQGPVNSAGRGPFIDKGTWLGRQTEMRSVV